MKFVAGKKLQEVLVAGDTFWKKQKREPIKTKQQKGKTGLWLIYLLTSATTNDVILEWTQVGWRRGAMVRPHKHNEDVSILQLRFTAKAIHHRGAIPIRMGTMISTLNETRQRRGREEVEEKEKEGEGVRGVFSEGEKGKR